MPRRLKVSMLRPGTRSTESTGSLAITSAPMTLVQDTLTELNPKGSNILQTTRL